jgi:hypothetical protein
MSLLASDLSSANAVAAEMGECRSPYLSLLPFFKKAKSSWLAQSSKKWVRLEFPLEAQSG